MKTVVRFLIAVGVVFTAVLLATSCDDDDKDNQTTIIGNWKIAQTEVTVTPLATATLSKEQLEAAVANYVLFPVNSRVVFTNDAVTFAPSINGADPESMTCQYVLNKDVLSIVLPLSQAPSVQGDVDLTDNILKITLSAESFTQLLKTFAKDDADFKNVVDQISSATVYYRLVRL